MCPVCWISGILFLLFGASALSFGTEWYILIPSLVLLAYGGYKIWDGIKKGKNFLCSAEKNFLNWDTSQNSCNVMTGKIE